MFVAHSHEDEPPCPKETYRDMGEDRYLQILSEELEIRIRSINAVIVPLYTNANLAANNAKKIHKLISKIAFLAATIAAILALIQISKLHQSEFLLLAEMTAILLAIGSWILESILGYHKRWITERHKAERYRFLKFRQIIDPHPAERCKTEVLAIQAIRVDSPVKTFIYKILNFHNQNNQQYDAENDTKDQLRPISDWTETAGLCIDDYSFKTPVQGNRFWELIQYYICVRLNYQLSFYKTESMKNAKYETVLKFLCPSVFCLIAMVTIAHVFYDWGSSYSFESAAPVGELDLGLGFILIFIAALLFVIHSGLKTLKGIFAFPLVYKTYRSTANALSRCRDDLLRNLENSTQGGINQDGREYLQALDRSLMLVYNCEEIMQREHASWFTIMNQTEMV